MEIGIEEVGFEVFPERSDRGAISYLKGERDSKSSGVFISTAIFAGSGYF